MDTKRAGNENRSRMKGEAQDSLILNRKLANIYGQIIFPGDKKKNTVNKVFLNLINGIWLKTYVISKFETVLNNGFRIRLIFVIGKPRCV